MALDMNTMGLDLSLTSTGISVNGKTSSICSTTRGPARLVAIRNEVVDSIVENQVRIVAIEGYSYASRNSQAHSLGELGGVIRVALHEKALPYVVIAPTARAKFATGKGNASKSEVVSAVSAKTGIVWSGADGVDRCDAWVLEEMLRTALGGPSYDWTRDQLDALKKVDWDFPIEWQGAPFV